MTTSPAPTFLADIGQALKRELIAHNTYNTPHHLVAHVNGWTAPNPTLEIWSCPANPNATWHNARLPGETPVDEDNLEVSLLYVDVDSSDVCPVSPYDSMDGFPKSHISSNFKGVGRFFAERTGSERAPRLFLPEPGLAYAWPILVESAEVNVVACYDVVYRGPGWRTGGTGWVTLCGRYSQESLDGGYRNLNAHLMDAPPPASWRTCRQYGIPHERLRKDKQETEAYETDW